jgi:hypothetical protein
VILPRQIARGIIDGRVTQIRRPDVKRVYKPGERLPIMAGHQGPAACFVKVKEAWKAETGEINQATQACGWKTTLQFRADWVRWYDKTWIRDLVEDDDLTLAMRYDRRWTQRPVWVLTVHLDRTQQPRLLAARPSPDYVTNPARAMPREPEAVDEHTQAWITGRANMELEQWLVMEQAMRERMTIEARLRDARTAAYISGVDISRFERELKGRVRALEQKVRKEATETRSVA